MGDCCYRIDIKKSLPEELLTKNGEISKEEIFKNNELIGIYFSAHWCPPCRQFTPILSNFYKKINANEKKLEIIFCSSDKNENDFNEYFNSMPWTSIPYNSPSRNSLPSNLWIFSIPTLYILDKNGEIIDKNGRDSFWKYDEKSYDYWKSLFKVKN